MELLIIIVIVGVIVGSVYLLKKYFKIDKNDQIDDEDDYLKRVLNEDESDEPKE